MNNVLTIAVQKSNRISTGFLELLNKCGLITNTQESKLYCKFQELPIELYFVRGNDIPSLLSTKFDIAILGQDSFLEHKLDNTMDVKRTLDFAKCRLSFAGKNPNQFELNNKRIATSYVNILQNYLSENNINADIVEMNGSVETSIALGLADIIFDIVQTGSTLMQQGLHELQKIIDLEAIMITKKNFQSETLNKLLFRIDGVLNGKPSKYLMFNIQRNLLSKITEILPAGKSPTILNLANENYCAVHTLCNKNDIWTVCEQLIERGAEDILINNIDLRFL